MEVLRPLQRKVLISVTFAYRTVLTETLYVAADAVSIDILFAELRTRYEIRKVRNAEIGGVAIPFNDNPEEAIGLIRTETLKI